MDTTPEPPIIDVLVETNWVVGWAAPPHRALPAASALLERAAARDLRLHIPAFCIAEARRTIRTKFQPRNEADAIRAFLTRSGAEVSRSSREATLEVLSRYEVATREWLAGLDDRLASLRAMTGVEVFALDDAMLERSVALSFELELKPFDQSVLAAVLERARHLAACGPTTIVFCELDSDLHFVRKDGSENTKLRDLYEIARVAVVRGFDLTLT